MFMTAHGKCGDSVDAKTLMQKLPLQGRGECKRIQQGENGQQNFESLVAASPPASTCMRKSEAAPGEARMIMNGFAYDTANLTGHDHIIQLEHGQDNTK